jgi:hypothetical protein
VADPQGGTFLRQPPELPTLPAELEARIAAFEDAAPAPDFDTASWAWMILLGVVLPIALMLLGWWA